MNHNLRNLSCGDIFNIALLVHVVQIDTANVNVWIAMKVDQESNPHAKQPKIVAQLPEMLRQLALRRLKFNNNLSIANQVRPIGVRHLPAMELWADFLLRLKWDTCVR